MIRAAVAAVAGAWTLLGAAQAAPLTFQASGSLKNNAGQTVGSYSETVSYDAGSGFNVTGSFTSDIISSSDLFGGYSAIYAYKNYVDVTLFVRNAQLSDPTFQATQRFRIPVSGSSFPAPITSLATATDASGLLETVSGRYQLSPQSYSLAGSIDVTGLAVPLPRTAPLFGAALLALAGCGWLRRRQQA